MSKEQLIDRHAQTLKSYVGTGLAKDECIGLIKNAVDEALFLYGVSRSKPNRHREIFDLAQESIGRKYSKNTDTIIEIDKNGNQKISKI
jgi:hypothetical protein